MSDGAFNTVFSTVAWRLDVVDVTDADVNAGTEKADEFAAVKARRSNGENLSILEEKYFLFVLYLVYLLL